MSGLLYGTVWDISMLCRMPWQVTSYFGVPANGIILGIPQGDIISGSTAAGLG
jgi:hypothetical protein